MHSIPSEEERPSAVIARAKLVSTEVSTTDVDSGVNATSTGGDSKSKQESRRVLLVDDQPSVLRSIARVLSLRGYSVVTATNGVDAIKLVSTGDYDVVVSDIAMPEMDGIRLLREIRAHDLYVPVILMTGEPTVDTAVKAMEHGAIHYLTKPFSCHCSKACWKRRFGCGK